MEGAESQSLLSWVLVTLLMAEKPNIIWLTFDSIRQDRTSFDHCRDTTPELQRIANSRNGYMTDQCFAHGIWSAASVGSIMTGKLPVQHNISGRTDTLSPTTKSLAERFKDAGYHTEGLSTNPWFSPDLKMDRGFDSFTYLTQSNLLTAGFLPLLKWVLQIRQHSGGFTVNSRKHQTDYIATEFMKKRLRELMEREEPFFLYSHTQGTHTAYYPPPKYLGEFSNFLNRDPTTARDLTFKYCRDIQEILASDKKITSKDWNDIQVMYDSLLYYIDSLIGDLFSYIDKADPDNLLLIITSDHGDLIGENGLLGHHFTLRDELLNVPCVIYGWGVDSSWLSGICQHFDVAKTVLQMADGDTEGYRGYDLRNRQRQIAISQRLFDYVELEISRVQEHNSRWVPGDYFLGNDDATSLRTSSKKLIKCGDNEYIGISPEIDEYQVEPRSSDINRLQEYYNKYISSLKRPRNTGQKVDFSRSTKQQLDNLGYL